MEDYNLIENSEAVIDAFGYWPEFHDGEIHQFILDNTDYNPSIDFILHGWEMTSEVDEKGYFKHQKNHLVHFHFEGIYDVNLEDFNHQNVIMALNIQELPKNEQGLSALLVEIDPSFGLGAEFKAHKARVVSVTPCTENGKN